MRWPLIVGAMVVWGLFSGWGIGLVLRAASADYLVVPSDYVALGGRLGLLSGAIMATFALISSRPVRAARQLVRAMLVGVATATFFPCLATMGFMSLTVWPTFAPGLDHLAHPRRYLLFLALHHGWLAGTAIGTAIAATLLWRQRGGSIG